MEAAPERWERWIAIKRDVREEGRRMVVGETIASFGGHLVEHVEETRAIRSACDSQTDSESPRRSDASISLVTDIAVLAIGVYNGSVKVTP